MKSSVDNFLAKLAVAIKDIESQNTIGTGVIYHSAELDNRVYVLTAAHVLFYDGDAFNSPYEKISIEFYNPRANKYEQFECSVDLNLVSSHIDTDLAVLVLEKEAVEKITGSLPKVECLKERHSISDFILKGFPVATRGKELVTIHPYWKQSMTGVNKFQLEMREDYDGRDMNGFSGSGAFLHEDNTAYLLGIFTRYREEGRGKIIYCQYLHFYNAILSNNFLPELCFTYLGEHGLTRSYFEKQVTFAIKNLGPRFNEALNFRLPIAELFHDLAKDNIFKLRIIKIFDVWLMADQYSYPEADSPHMKDIENAYADAKFSLIDQIPSIGWLADQEIKLDDFITQLENLSKIISLKRSELSKIQSELVQKQPPQIKDRVGYRPPFETHIRRINEIEENNDSLIEALNSINLPLSNNACLLIQGEAGCGKSHLLGDIAKQRVLEGRPTLLLLGQLFKSSSDCWKQLLEQLHLKCTKEQFLQSLNSIGEQTGSRCLILIDALNEGSGKDLWPDQLSGFIEEIRRYPFIGLALTVRSSYYNAVIPDNVTSDLTISHFTHEGFKGKEYEALRLFCEHYDLYQPNFPILSTEFANPLFLQLICQGLNGSNSKTFPQGFQGVSTIFGYYLNSIASKLAKKRSEYRLRPNLTNKAVTEIAKAIQEKKFLKSLTLEEAVNLFEEKFPNHRFLLDDLIQENVLMQSSWQHYDSDIKEEIIHFAFEKLGDFIIAEELLKPYSSPADLLADFQKNKVLGKIPGKTWNSNIGILEAFAVLLPERFDLEITDAFDCNTDDTQDDTTYYMRYRISHILIDSLKWRRISSINNDKITAFINSGNFPMDEDTFYNKVLQLSTLIGHPFNSDRMTANLMRIGMPQRDSKWQDFFRYYSGYNDHGSPYPLRRLIDWAWQPGISRKVDDETARLAAQTLTWVLSSCHRQLRDQATKAMVNLLEDKPEALILILNKFREIDDPYIAERLYGVAYGCALRTNGSNSLSILAQSAYDLVFSNGNPTPHVLLRDYARNTIEFAVYKNANIDIDINLIRPPYKSKLPDSFPTDDDMKAFELDDKSAYFENNYGRLYNFIKFDVLSWDFGKKEVESAFRNFSPVSFTMEKEYKLFLKGLKKEARSLLKLLETISKQRGLLERRISSAVSQTHQGALRTAQKNQGDMLAELPEVIKKVLSLEEHQFFISKILPHFLNLSTLEKGYPFTLDTAPIKRWIVQRAHSFGYSAELHAKFDYFSEKHIGNDGAYIERIGAKYQWMALHEMVALVADNHKFRDGYDYHKKYQTYQGPWQQYLRDINLSFVTKNKSGDAEPVEGPGVPADFSQTWWWDDSYRYWHGSEENWVSNLSDIPNPASIINRKDDKGTEWLYLRTHIYWSEPKPIGEDRYHARLKKLWYLFQGYLVNNKDKNRIVASLSKKDFRGRSLLETHRANHSLINRENYWSPASNAQKNEKWEIFDERTNKLMVATSEAVGELSQDRSGANYGYEMPCKLIFEGMNLSYSPNDGDFFDRMGNLVATVTDRNGLLINKEKFLLFLNENNLDIVWALLGEKNVYGGSDRPGNLYTVFSGVYSWDNNKIVGQFRKSKKEN